VPRKKKTLSYKNMVKDRELLGKVRMKKKEKDYLPSSVRLKSKKLHPFKREKDAMLSCKKKNPGGGGVYYHLQRILQRWGATHG